MRVGGYENARVEEQSVLRKRAMNRVTGRRTEYDSVLKGGESNHPRLQVMAERETVEERNPKEASCMNTFSLLSIRKIDFYYYFYYFYY